MLVRQTPGCCSEATEHLLTRKPVFRNAFLLEDLLSVERQIEGLLTGIPLERDRMVLAIFKILDHHKV